MGTIPFGKPRGISETFDDRKFAPILTSRDKFRLIIAFSMNSSRQVLDIGPVWLTCHSAGPRKYLNNLRHLPVSLAGLSVCPRSSSR